MKEYCKKYQKAILLALLFSLVCFGFMLTNFTVTIDEETWLLGNEESALWLLQGRISIWLFNLLFTQGGNYAPFLWDFCAVILWSISGIIFAYALLGGRNENQSHMFIFLAYYSSLPYVVGEILSFSLFNLQIGLAMVAVAIAFVFTMRYWENGEKRVAIWIFLLLLYSFGTYQAMICVYVTAVVAYCLLRVLDYNTENLGRNIVSSGIFCTVSAIVYYGVFLLIGHFVGTAGYLTDNYSGWAGENPLLEVVKAVANVVRISFAIPYKERYIYGGGVICFVTAAFVIYSIWRFFKAQSAKERLSIFFYSVALCVAPFSLYIVLATSMTHGRMLLALPFAGAVEIVLILEALTKRRLQIISFVAAGLLLFFNARNMNMIFYYSHLVYEKDCDLTAMLMYDIEKKGIDYHEKPIAFIGMIEEDSLPIQKIDALGSSIFAWDEGNNTRMEDFIRTRGYAVETADAEKMQEALQETENMQTWPQENSIKELEDVIVVYLSDPTEQWYTVNGIVH